MKLLAIETSTKRFSLTVSNGAKILKSRSLVLNKVLSSSIIPAIEKILKEAKMKLKDIDGFVVGLGPGSFTSLRVGLATIKGLAFATEKPIIGIPSLDAISAGFLKQTKDNDQICVLLDARRNLVYACLYENAAGTLKRKSEYLLTSLADLLGRIEKDTIFVGDGITLYQDEIKKFGHKVKFTFAPAKYWHPEAKQLVVLAQERCQKQKFDNLDKLVPLYLYPEDCQVSSTPKPGT